MGELEAEDPWTGPLTFTTCRTGVGFLETCSVASPNPVDRQSLRPNQPQSLWSCPN